MNHRAQQHPLKQFLNRYPQVLVYCLILSVFFFSLWLDNQNRDADDRERAAQIKSDQIERCKAAVETRNVDRDQTQRIYSLATGTISKTNEEIRTPEQQAQVDAYLKRVKDFRRESFATIKPSKICAKYVKDDQVTPEQWEKEHPPNQLEDDEPGDTK